MSRNYLSKNDELRRGDYLISNNKKWKAVFQDDGNFVIYGWTPVWTSDTYGSDAFRLCMQADCNLVMYNRGDVLRWHTNTNIKSESSRTTSKTEIGTNDKLCKGEVLMSNNELWKAVFQNDGNFVIYGWKAMWDSDTCGSDGSRMVLQPDGNLVLYNESREPRIMSKNFLAKNEELWNGEYLMSKNGEFKAVFKEDGNFVIYKWSPVWSSDTVGSGVVRLCMQADCNLVMYTKGNDPKWHTNSYRPEFNTCRLQLTDDGKLVVNKDCEEIWSSANSKGMK
ncbi:hypothetical protein L3Q82_004659 [Xyrichtys novacula]|uniref:Bulb-type lectin domain-containing protein n=1 Tax=Xyrichtys novacula TaxID=13765 RepID=A0AAV1HC04_XYRNO|nr:hypothetical protein L3Q82_004659 [Xyrichtys novacula]